MKAIVHDEYGSPDVLELEEIDKPVVKDDEVLVRVHAAAVHAGDWSWHERLPYFVRMATGLLKPKNTCSGIRCGRAGRGGRQECEAVSTRR